LPRLPGLGIDDIETRGREKRHRLQKTCRPREEETAIDSRSRTGNLAGPLDFSLTRARFFLAACRQKISGREEPLFHPHTMKLQTNCDHKDHALTTVSPRGICAAGAAEFGSCLTDATRQGRSRRAVRNFAATLEPERLR